jgi:hypothetical protein
VNTNNKCFTIPLIQILSSGWHLSDQNLSAFSFTHPFKNYGGATVSQGSGSHHGTEKFLSLGRDHTL